MLAAGATQGRVDEVENRVEEAHGDMLRIMVGSGNFPGTQAAARITLCDVATVMSVRGCGGGGAPRVGV